MTSKYPAILILSSALWLLAACGSTEQTSSRTNSYGTTHDGERGNPSAGPNTAGTAANTSGGTGAGGPLAGYLFSLADAQAISPLVLSYEESSTKSQNTAQDASMNSTRDFIASFLDDTMKLSEHSPGRDFSVVVSADTTPNASALNQSLVIHKGIIDFASNLSLALVVCHEIAHSTRNHSARSEKHMIEYENKNKSRADALDKELNALAASAYDKGTGKFTHTQADYKRVKPVWDAFWKDFVVFQKRFESEADVVGGRICGNAGFSTDEVEKGFTSLFASFQGMTGVKIKEGTYAVEEDKLAEFLQSIYGDDVHPTDKERGEQIERVKPVFKQGASPAIATRWKNEFPGGIKLLSDSMRSGQKPVRHLTPADNIMIRRTKESLER